MRKRFGFTLLEILLVLAIFGMLSSTVVPKLGNLFRVSVNSSVRRYSALVRYTYNQAVLTGRLHRIVINLDEKTWGIEMADPGQLPIDKAKRSAMPEGLSENQRVESEPGFKAVGKGVADALPRGVTLVSVKSWRTGDAEIKEGIVSIYAYPNGMIDEATVTLSEEGREEISRYKITTIPLTGRVDVETEQGAPQ